MKIQSLDLHLTDRCNLNCKYCYLHQEGYVIRPDIDDGLIELLPEIVKRLGVTKINFFGGEPLLAIDKIKKVIEKLKDTGVKFGISTNGIIDKEEIRDLIRTYKISVQRSIDGCPEACSLNRPDVTDKYLKLTELYQDYGKARRSTITEDAAKYVYKSWLWLKNNGFNQGWTPIPDNYKEWSDESIQTFIEQHKLIARDLVYDVLSGKPPFYNFWFSRLISCILTPNNIGPKGCGAGTSLLALRQDGNFLACHRFVSDDCLSDWCFGNVEDLLSGKGLKPGPTAREAIETCKKKFNESPIFEKCKTCLARAGCPGGCYHTNRAINNNAAIPTETFCKMRIGMLPVVQWIHEKLKDVNPTWYKGKTGNAKQVSAKNQPSQRQSSSPKNPCLPIGKASCSAQCKCKTTQ